MGKKKYIIFALLGLVTQLSSYLKKIPQSYKLEIGSGRYIFVMLQTLKWSTPILSSDGTPYPISGLYLNNGSTVPLWTIDWFEEKSNIFISSDGKFLVKFSNYPYGTPTMPAIQFISNGVFIKSYSFKELTPNFQEFLFVAWFFGRIYHLFQKEWLTASFFDDKGKKIRIYTITGEKYIFDFTTGAMIGKAIF